MFDSLFHRATLRVALVALCAAASVAAEEPKNSEGSSAPSVEVLYTGYTKNADHSTSVFVRMTGEVPVAAAQRPQQLTYHLAGAHLKAQNNLNPLLTEHFGPPVSRISLVTAKDGIDLVIDLTEPQSGDPASYKVTARDGRATLLVSFPPPSSS
jgi:hypothetical protein